jgi:methylmalonic aciduria homocystinuria type C protein
VRHIAAGCAAAGLDLVQPLRVGWYNDRIEAELRVPDLGRPANLAVLIGNTRVLWERFVEALRRDPGRAAGDDPLDDYVIAAITEVLSALPHRREVRWAHDTRTPVAMQRLAQIAGLAHLAPSHLSVHPVFGPWIALRAVAILDVEGPAQPPPAPPNPCDRCEDACLAAYRRAVDLAGASATSHGALSEHWEHWRAIRDACPAGRAYRYGDAQIRYHYTKDRAILLGGIDT